VTTSPGTPAIARTPPASDSREPSAGDFVVDLLDKFAHMFPQLEEAGIAAGINFFPLEGFDEALALAVFPRSGGPAHTQMRAAGFQPFHVFVAGILRSTVGVVHQTGLRAAAGEGRFQSRQRQPRLQRPAQFPADRLA